MFDIILKENYNYHILILYYKSELIKMKKLITLFLGLLIAINTVVPCFAVGEANTPQIIETVYPTDEVVIADIVIDADSSGESDVTAV